MRAALGRRAQRAVVVPARPFPPHRAASSSHVSALLDSLPPPAHFQSTANIRSASEQAQLHALSLSDPAAFWGGVADTFTWRKKWDTVCGGTGFGGEHAVTWFAGAELNITENALDRHIAAGHGAQPAITWESDDGASTTYSFKQVRVVPARALPRARCPRAAR